LSGGRSYLERTESKDDYTEIDIEMPANEKRKSRTGESAGHVLRGPGTSMKVFDPARRK
jgi:hypothetical protein